jgi:hypothetical protein
MSEPLITAERPFAGLVDFDGFGQAPAAFAAVPPPVAPEDAAFAQVGKTQCVVCVRRAWWRVQAASGNMALWRAVRRRPKM